MNKKYTYVLLPLIVIITCFVLWAPSQLMITDELSYYFQAQNWIFGNSGNTLIDVISGTTYTLIEGHYPPGNSFILAGLLKINDSLIYYIGLFYLIGSILFLYKSLRKSNLPLISLGVVYLFIPLVFITRTTMSEMPSLFLVSLGINLYYNNNTKSYLWLAFITGLSIAFRETNILLLAPLAFFISRNYVYSAFAFLLGASFRCIGYYILKTNPFFVKEGYPFGLEYVPDTLIIYSIILLIFLPLSPIWFTKVPRERIKTFGIALISFLTLHLVYGYVAHVYSGYTNGLLLNGRFWIPASPFFVIAMGYYIRDKKWINKNWIGILTMILIVIVQTGIHYKSYHRQSEYLQFRNALQANTKDHITFIDLNSRTPIYRYIYPFVLEHKWSDINLMNDKFHMQKTFEATDVFRIALISSGATVAQSSRNSQFYNMINETRENYLVENILEICPNTNSCLNIYEVRKMKANQ